MTKKITKLEIYFMVLAAVLAVFGYLIYQQNENTNAQIKYINERLEHSDIELKKIKLNIEDTKTELKIFKDDTGKLLSQAESAIQIARSKGLSGEVGMAIFKEAHKNGLDPSFVLAIIEAESTFRNLPPNECGATGLMQVTQSTGANAARRMGLGSYDLNDPIDNIKIGCYLFGNLVRSYGDEHAALTAYNMGDGGLQSHIAYTGTSRSDYSVTVMRYRNKYE